MIEWKVPPKIKQTKLIGNKIKIGNSLIVFTKESLEILITKYSKGKGVMVGTEDSILYLRDSKDGYKVNKQGNHYSIITNSSIIESLMVQGIKKGIYELESVGDGTFKCNLVEESE